MPCCDTGRFTRGFKLYYTLQEAQLVCLKSCVVQDLTDVTGCEPSLSLFKEGAGLSQLQEEFLKFTLHNNQTECMSRGVLFSSNSQNYIDLISMLVLLLMGWPMQCTDLN